MVHLQTSNQSPTKRQCGTPAITPPESKRGEDGKARRRRQASRVGPVRNSLLAWHRRSGRDLPWRRTRDPYAILVSEVMLQQTQVARVVSRYLAWLERWPTVGALAAAPAAEAIRAWQGLCSNPREVNLHPAGPLVADG